MIKPHHRKEIIKVIVDHLAAIPVRAYNSASVLH
jgi:hypothetical protein